MKVIYVDVSECSECKSKNIGFNEVRGEFFCKNCGFVLMDNIPVIEAKYGKIEKVMVNKKQKKVAVVIQGILKNKTEKKKLKAQSKLAKTKAKYNFPELAEPVKTKWYKNQDWIRAIADVIGIMLTILTILFFRI